MLNLYNTYIDTHALSHTQIHRHRYTHRLYTLRHIHTYIHTALWAILVSLSGHSHHHRAGLEKLLHVSLAHRSTSPSERPTSAVCAAVETTVSRREDKGRDYPVTSLIQQCVISNSVPSKVRYSDREQLPVPSCRF